MYFTCISLLVLVTFVQEGASITVEDCPPNLPRDNYLHVYESVCFQFEYERRKDYDDANNDCKLNGGTLALVKSADIQEFLYNLVDDYLFYDDQDFVPLWIGLNDKEREGTFVWQDGTEVTYSNWDIDEGPNHAFANTQDCGTLDPFEGKWVDERCEADFIGSIFSQGYRPYICQYNTTETSTGGPTE